MDRLLTICIVIGAGVVQVNTSSSSCPSSICQCTELEIASRMETEILCNTGPNKGYVPVFHSFSQPISSLYLSRIELTILGNGSFRELTTVREMYLNDNLLIRIENRAFSVIDHTIELLDLQHNKLRNLHFLTTHDFSRLRELLLRDNQLVTISPGSFALLPALENLNLDDNSITGALTFLKQPSLKALLSLNLDANLLTDIDANDFLYLTNLRSLLVNRNQLLNVEFLSQDAFKQLQGFSAAYNQLTSVDSSIFADKDLLKWIDFSNNKLTDVSFLSMCNLKRLEEIYLSSNKLTSLPEDSFQATSTLTVFSVDGNLLQTLPRCAMLPFYQHLQTFDISNNPMRCNCELSWLQQPHTITTERPSECVNLEFEYTNDYDTTNCELLPTCVTLDACNTGTEVNSLYGNIFDGLQEEYHHTTTPPGSIAVQLDMNFAVFMGSLVVSFHLCS